MNIFNKYQGKVETHISINKNTHNKVYNIYLNPNVKFNSNNPSYNIEIVYNFDFTTMPEGKYRVSFSYVGEFQRIRPLGRAPEDEQITRAYIFCDLGQQAHSFMPDNRTATNVRHQSTTFLGVLQHRETPTTSDDSGWDFNFLSATEQNNPPMFLDNRPSKNEINITVCEYDETNPLDSFPRYKVVASNFAYPTTQYNQNYNKFLKDYHMTLHFELLEENVGNRMVPLRPLL